MPNTVQYIAPFINDQFLITSKWWNYRDNPTNPGTTQLHRGLDIATSGSKPVYSILNGIVHSLGYDSSRGNWIIIKDDNPDSLTYGYATYYMHLAQRPLISVGESIAKGQYVAMEGTTGNSTGIHLHIEMQNLNLFNNVWTTSDNQSDYIDPTAYMGIDNIQGTWWLYDGTPINPPTPTRKKKKFNFVLTANKRRGIYG